MLTADFSKGLPDLRTGVYRHYKGPLYLVLGYGHDANADTLLYWSDKGVREVATFEERNVVIYIGLELTDSHKGPRLAVRTAEDFFALVCNKCGDYWECMCSNPAAEPVPRFEYLGPAWYGQR